MAALHSAFFCGLLFAFGLVIGGMTQPSKVVDFLDFTGSWDPSLGLVLGGALGTSALLRRWAQARSQPLFAPAFMVPGRTDINAPLLAGAALFGVGWGLGGFCPGPVLVALGGGMESALWVAPAMLVGMLLHDRWYAAPSRPPAATGSGQNRQPYGSHRS